MKKFFILAILLSLFLLLQGDTPWELVWRGALQRFTGASTDWNPLLDERIPRLIVLLCTGASLAVSGAVMQSLFRNPLASPSVLGITSGGSLLVMIVFIMGWHTLHPSFIPLAAVIGCLTTLLGVYFLAQKQSGSPINNLILTGIAISTVLFAMQSAILYALRNHWQLILTLTVWENGTSIDRSWHHVHMQLPLTCVGLFGCYHYRQEMNLLTLGEEEACNLGVEVEKVRWRLFLCVALLTGGAIASMGIIAFFGLVLPHVIRRWSGPDHRILIPLTMIGGGATLSILDLLLRLFNIHAFSIGNVSAVIGGVFFLSLLFRVGQRRVYA